jgi:preprotein translocase subunit SecA
MFKSVIGKLFGTRHERERRRVQPIVDEINEHYARLATVSEEELRGQTAKFRAALRERTGEIESRIAGLKEAKRGTADPRSRRCARRAVGSSGPRSS